MAGALHTVSPAEENYTFPVLVHDSLDVFSAFHNALEKASSESV